MSSSDFAAFIGEQLEPLGEVRVRRMFGGAGLFRDQVMFGLIAGDVLYLKADEATRPAFEAAATQPFRYRRNGRTVEMSYWEVPGHLYDDPDELRAWADAAWRSAVHARGLEGGGQG